MLTIIIAALVLRGEHVTLSTGMAYAWLAELVVLNIAICVIVSRCRQ